VTSALRCMSSNWWYGTSAEPVSSVQATRPAGSSLIKTWFVQQILDNLFDKRPPYIQSWTDGNTDTMTYDLLGRRWHVRLGYRF